MNSLPARQLVFSTDPDLMMKGGKESIYIDYADIGLTLDQVRATRGLRPLFPAAASPEPSRQTTIESSCLQAG